jgi:hypothetical protein
LSSSATGEAATPQTLGFVGIFVGIIFIADEFFVVLQQHAPTIRCPLAAPDVLIAITEQASHSFAKYNLAPAPSGDTGASIGKATLNLGPRRHGVACF